MNRVALPTAAFLGVLCVSALLFVPAVTEALVQLLQDPERRQRLGQNGARQAQEYDWKTLLQQEWALLSPTIPGKAAPHPC